MDLKYLVFISVTHTMLSTLVSKALLGEDLKYGFVISAANHRYWEIEHQCKWFSVLFDWWWASRFLICANHSRFVHFYLWGFNVILCYLVLVSITELWRPCCHSLDWFTQAALNLLMRKLVMVQRAGKCHFPFTPL